MAPVTIEIITLGGRCLTCSLFAAAPSDEVQNVQGVKDQLKLIRQGSSGARQDAGRRGHTRGRLDVQPVCPGSRAHGRR